MKLVRDGIPMIAAQEQKDPKARFRLTEYPSEYQRLLRSKLVEESSELITADEEGVNVAYEAADVIEVALAIAARNGVTQEEVMGELERKRHERGAFKAGVVML